MKDCDGKKKKHNQPTFDLHIKHVLPKANEIVKTAEQVVKSIYPFDLFPPLPSQYLDIPFESPLYDVTAKNNRIKFTPNCHSVATYFEKNNIIYDKFNHSNSNPNYSMNIYSIDKLKQLSKNDFVLQIDKTSPLISATNDLQFDSRFQSGNLSAVAFKNGLYCLLLHNDVNTTGYTNWFYFSATSRAPLRAKLAIMNYGKAGWPMNMFPGICVWTNTQNRWTRITANAQCESNRVLYPLQQPDGFNTLYFEFDFKPNQKVFFAYTPPYTYTDLLHLLDSIEQHKPSFFHRKLAGTTLMGNRLELITITNFQKIKKTETDLPVIVILARTHAGQTASSWTMHYLIKYLLSNQEHANSLRNNFIFKIFPMVNPDGVIHGNYRCSLIGRDLNRRWKNPVKEYYPEVYFIKNQITDTADRKQIKMVLDLHGHTQKRKAFFFGCTDKVFPHKPRLFPYLTTKLCTHFQFSSCNFAMQKSKQSTARITLYNQLRCQDIFTLQVSQFGMQDKFLSSSSLQQIGQTLARAIHTYYKLDPNNHKTVSVEQVEQEIICNNLLLKVGCDPSEGSDSEPSLCNINFDKINKMSINLQARPRSENTSLKKRNKHIHETFKNNSNRNLREQRISSLDRSRDISAKKEGAPTIKLRGMTSAVQRRYKVKGQRSKFQFTRESQSISKLNQIAAQTQKRPVRMINFQLLIGESVRRGREDGLQSLEVRLNQPNPYYMFQNRCMFRNKSSNWNKTML